MGYIPEELQTNPLPEMPVFLGYCWSYSRSTPADKVAIGRLTMAVKALSLSSSNISYSLDI